MQVNFSVLKKLKRFLSSCISYQASANVVMQQCGFPAFNVRSPDNTSVQGVDMLLEDHVSIKQQKLKLVH